MLASPYQPQMNQNSQRNQSGSEQQQSQENIFLTPQKYGQNEDKNYSAPVNPSRNAYQSRMSILWSAIDDQGHTELSPQSLRVKNNILLALLALSAYGIYYLISGYIDYIITGYITGLTYNQTKQRFTKFILKSNYNQLKHNTSIGKRILKSMLLIVFVIVLPRLRYMLIYPHEFTHFFQMQQYITSVYKNRNLTVIITQAVVSIYALYELFGPTIARTFRKIRPKKITNGDRKCVEFMFGFFTLLITLGLIALIPAILFKQVGDVGFLIQKKVQQKLDCQLFRFGQHINQSLPLCSQKVAESSFIKSIIQEFRDQNQTVNACKDQVNKFQIDYLGQSYFHYDQMACTWYSMIIKASNYTAIQSQTQDISTASIFSTGTSIFKKIFGNVASILGLFSNILFCFGIWMSSFSSLSNSYLQIKQIFSSNKQELVSDIAQLVNATCMIVLWHFIISVILLELFAFTPVNLTISILLSLMAFIPYFRPWFGVFIVAVIRVLIYRDYISLVIATIFTGIYLTVSEKIYSLNYNKIQMHEIIVNWSVLFGIIGFGISGIFYGPLIIIIYTCVQRELLTIYKGGKLMNKHENKKQNQLQTMRKLQSDHSIEDKNEVEENLNEKNDNLTKNAVKVTYIKKQSEQDQLLNKNMFRKQQNGLKK